MAARVALDADTTASYTVTVTATDPWGPDADPTGAASQEVTITINNVNEAPAITVGATKTSVDENTAITEMVSTYTATDVDQTAEVTWSVSGTDAADFNISNEAGTLGQLTFKEIPNYEMPADSNRDNVYMVTVVATDAGVDSKNKMTAERAVVVTVANMVEEGTVTLLSVQPKIGFPLTASVTDLDGGETGITWKWERDSSGGAAPDGTPTSDCSGLAADAWEDAEEDMGAKTATYTPDVKDEGKCLRATAMYTDGKGMDETMGVSDNAVIKDLANKAPEFRAGGVDDEAATAVDSGAVVMSAKRSIDENVVPVVTDVPADNPANVGMPVAAYDPNDDKLTYTLSGNGAGSFDINPSDGQISAKMKLDREAKSSHMVKVTATDPDGADASIDVTITVTNVDDAPVIMRAPDANVAPEFADSEDGARSVAEDTAAGGSIGNPVEATDDNNDTLTYVLGGTDAASFDINPDTGQLMTLAALDYETKASYSVTVTASDSGGLSGSIDVTITVTNVNEAPVAPTVANQTATKDTAFSYIVPAFTDLEGGTITYTATLSDDSELPGWLSFNASTRELSGTPLEADTPASLTIEVSATDDGSPSASAQVTFTLTVGEEAPTTLLVRYDADEDGWIKLEEARVAVGDYFGPPKGVELSLDDTRKVVGLYFEYKNRP